MRESFMRLLPPKCLELYYWLANCLGLTWVSLDKSVRLNKRGRKNIKLSSLSAILGCNEMIALALG